MTKTPIYYRYQFRLADVHEQAFDVQLDPQTLNLRIPARAVYPDWTRLAYHQCAHCPLNAQDHPHCPVAVNLIDLVVAFNQTISYTQSHIVVEVDERRYEKDVSAQKGISALLGIYMVANACPIMEKLKPMVRFHLPFATPDETLYRSLSMYLLAQFFVAKAGGEADWQLHGLAKIYEDVQIVNRNMSERLRSVLSADAGVNAVVILDSFAENAKYQIDTKQLDELAQLFKPYLKPSQ